MKQGCGKVCLIKTKFRREKRHAFSRVVSNCIPSVTSATHPFLGWLFLPFHHPKEPHLLLQLQALFFFLHLHFLLTFFLLFLLLCVNSRCFCWRCLLSVTQPRKFVGWDQRNFLEFWSHKVGIGIEVDFYNLWDLWPWKKKILWSLWISTWIKTSILSLDSTWNRKTETTRHGILPQGNSVPFLWAVFPRLLFAFSTIPQRSSVDEREISDPWLTWSSIHGCHEIIPSNIRLLYKWVVFHPQENTK